MDVYVAFIRERPHVHDLAYGPLVAKPDHPRLQRAAIAHWAFFMTLSRHVSLAASPSPNCSVAARPRGAPSMASPRLGALGQIPGSVPGDIDRLLHEALDTLRRGWQASGLEVDDPDGT
ncbi:MAG: hypothetical protein WKF78_07510 [Candidatus Limnocylindrales bacterium]